MSLMLRIIHYSSPFVDLEVFGLQNSLFLLIAAFLLINTRYIFQEASKAYLICIYIYCNRIKKANITPFQLVLVDLCFLAGSCSF